MPQNNFSYEFENHRVDVAQRVLMRDGESIPLTPKATDVLLMLLDKAGQLVEKDFLLNQVWPDSFVEENNLTQCIFVLRRALQEDSSGPKFIETVARRGFRFVAPVKKILAPPIALEQEPFTIPTRLPVLAVLAFINATGDPELQYLAEGIPETLINSFSGLSQLRVISRSTAFRYKTKQVDLQATGQKLGADVLLMGQIATRESALSVSVELMGVNSGWQLWGETFLVDSSNIFEIQDEITRQILHALNLPLSGEDEKRVAKRYTENVAAYQAYLEGRFHWSRYTRTGIERAIGHFGKAIELDPNYALAYAGIVDCYLRLATNYLPPEDGTPVIDEVEPDGLIDERNLVGSTSVVEHHSLSDGESTSKGVGSLEQAEGELLTDGKVKLRHEWDWKGAERELRRANELKTDYPAAHQWHAAYMFARDCFQAEENQSPSSKEVTDRLLQGPIRRGIPIGITPTERAQVFCTVAREQMAVGNFDAADRLLSQWMNVEQSSKISQLSEASAADLLFTLGTLVGYRASTDITANGQRDGERLLSGAIALFEHLGLEVRVAESRIELGRCFYREGLFDLARAELERALRVLVGTDDELRSVCLVVLGAVDRDAGRLSDSIEHLEAALAIGRAGHLVTGRCHHEIATTLKELAGVHHDRSHAHRAIRHFKRALYESEAIGNHRLSAASDNNLGFLLMTLGEMVDAEKYLLRARRRFERFRDEIRRAQVNETLARLYTATSNYDRALQSVLMAVSVLEKTDEEALVAEALTTLAVVYCRLTRFIEAKKIFADAYKVAERYGDREGCASALLAMLEEICEELGDEERKGVANHLTALIGSKRQTSLRSRFTHVVTHLRQVHSLTILYEPGPH